jgi:hypothetical protein
MPHQLALAGLIVALACVLYVWCKVLLAAPAKPVTEVPSWIEPYACDLPGTYCPLAPTTGQYVGTTALTCLSTASISSQAGETPATAMGRCYSSPGCVGVGASVDTPGTWTGCTTLTTSGAGEVAYVFAGYGALNPNEPAAGRQQTPAGNWTTFNPSGSCEFSGLGSLMPPTVTYDGAVDVCAANRSTGCVGVVRTSGRWLGCMDGTHGVSQAGGAGLGLLDM